MDADDVAIGMELEAMDQVPQRRGLRTWLSRHRRETVKTASPGVRWLQAKVRRRLDADSGEDGRLHGLFEVYGGQLGLAVRYADELRRQAVAGADGGSAAAWWVPGAVSVEVRRSASDNLGDTRVLVPTELAGDLAAALRAGAAFRWSSYGLGPAIWTKAALAGSSRVFLCASAAPAWPHSSVLLGPSAAAMLAGLIESAATGTRARTAELLPDSSDPDWGKKAIADALRRRDAASGVRGPWDDGFAELPPGLHEKAWRAACDKATDPLAGARARTDDNLRRVFGGD